MASIRLDNVVKRYDNGHVAVEQMSLEIRDGEFLVLVGPSGCGKSTTLRMIAGLEEVTSGDIFIGQKRVNDVEPGNRDIAMVFQNYALYPHMTVRQNMSFGLRMRRLAKSEIADRVDRAAQILSIESLLDRRPRELSGGQRQRVAVGRAIVRQPAAFLFDEPLSNLDAKLRAQMRTELARLHRRLKTTTVYVTHDQIEAMTLGERIVVMKDSVIQQVDTPLNIYHQPANRFVAEFIGSPAMNFITGRVEQGQFNANHGTQPAGYPLRDVDFELGDGQSILFGFRPQDVTLEAKQPKIADVTLDVVERMGHETMIYFDLANQPCVARLREDMNFDSGQVVSLHLSPKHCHLFRADGDQHRLPQAGDTSQPARAD